MESLAKLHHHHQPLHLSLNHRLPLFPKPTSSLSFQPPFPSSSSSSRFKSMCIKASSSQNPSSISSSVIKTTCIAVSAAALFFMRFQFKHVIAAPLPPSMVEPSKESAATDNYSDEEKERTIQEKLSVNPNDIDALQSLMEVNIKAGKLQEAIDVIDRLIELEPDEDEWPLLKAHVNRFRGEYELARKGFEDILAKDPLRVDAYHGIVTVVSESGQPLKNVLRRIEEAMERCKKEKKQDVRDFKLLIAQIKVVEGNYQDALKVYQELVKEEPRDFRPYLCQGIIYTLLKRKDEAEIQFEKYRRLVPKNHPYAEYLDDNMFATKLFSQKVERERAGSKI